jgi:hypothetical protein
LPRAFALIIAASAQAISSRGFIACSGPAREPDGDRDAPGRVEVGRLDTVDDAVGELLGVLGERDAITIANSSPPSR